MLHNVVTSDAQAARYREQGLWTAETLASRVADLAGSAASSVAVVDRLGQRSRTYAELARDAAGLAARLAAEGVGGGDVVSIQLPNCYEAVMAAVATNSLGAVLNPLLPNYRARELSHVFATADPKAVFIPATYRGFDHVALLDEVTARTGVSPYRIVVDVDADEPIAGAPGRAASARNRAGSRLGADLHLGHRGDPEGHHAHRGDRQLRCAGDVRRPRARRRRRWSGCRRRSGHSTGLQLRDPRRALPRGARSCCRTAGTPLTPPRSSLRTAATTRWPRRRSSMTSSATASAPALGCRA